MLQWNVRKFCVANNSQARASRSPHIIPNVPTEPSQNRPDQAIKVTNIHGQERVDVYWLPLNVIRTSITNGIPRNLPGLLLP